MPEWVWFILLIIVLGCCLVVVFLKRHKRLNYEIPAAYVKQLNVLLEQRDNRVVNNFINFFKVDADTIETHIVFGNLFRQQGEVEKSIRIHQNIINQQKLDKQHYASTMLELANDYFYTGLFDRAEMLLQQILSLGVASVKIEVYHQLISLYEVEKSWGKAIQISKKLQNLVLTKAYNNNIAHYYCELAEESIMAKDYASSIEYLAKGKRFNDSLLRSSILFGDIALHQGNLTEAREYYESALFKNPEFASLILPKIQTTLNDSNVQFSHYLEKLQTVVLSNTYIKIYVKNMIQIGDDAKIKEFFSQLKDYKKIPVSVLKMIIQYQLDKGMIKDTFFINHIIDNIEEDKKDDIFQCINCSFQSGRIHWLCPGCQHWDTVVPREIDIAHGTEKNSMPKMKYRK